ncbi:T9SS type A sorting domain-containing protein [Psychroflexus planctonicus]|uniref:Secretion system C-terminal sorting domain-containing protein n=1 Tax=Psychroflexus planctonicus TaxID=1526575 RepID=A0ABQ1SHZ1_9FLAO|nr:T9SS type A sorting domain-containing protein [Psychroflexus planctonicus]GGE40869.1 hypothetical protein GCM10010832_21190 [Psychroflexus planctonicus]
MNKFLLSIGFVFAFMLFGYGQTYVTIAEDDASNYTGAGAPNFGLNIGDNGGSGFNPWTWSDSGSSKSAFLGHGPNDSHGDIGNPSFGMFAQNDGSSINAYRSFSDLLNEERLEVEFTINFRAGAKGVEIFQNGIGVFLFQAASFGGDKYEYRDQTGTFTNTGWPYQANSIFRLTVTQVSATNAIISVERTNSTGHSVTLTNVNISGRVDEIRFFNENAGGGEQNFYFNNLSIERPTFTTIADGIFSDSTIWNDGIAPVGNGNITIAHDINLDTNLSLNGELSINTGNTLSVNDNVVLTNNGSININGDLVFKSTASGTAQYGNSTGTITGDVTVERFVPAKRAFRVLSSAVGGQSFADAWQQDTHITGTNGATNGFDVTSTNTPSLFTFDNSINPQTNGAGWQAVTSTTSTNIVAGTPYRLFVRGDRSVALNSNTSPATVTTLSAAGDMHTGSFSPSLATVANNYSFVGNPYQAVVDINATTRTNLTDFIYVWDASIAGDNGNGGFVTVPIPGSATPNPFSSDATQYVAPGQAFFVQNTASGNGSITFEEAHKTTAQTQQTPFNVNNEFYINSRLYKTSALANNEIESDAIGLRFNTNYTTLGSDEDAGKLGNPGENYVILNNGLKALDFQNMPTNGHVVELALVNYQDSAYSLSFDVNHQPEDLKVYLNDVYLGTQTEITAGLIYDFTVDASISESLDAFRFNISFELVSLSDVDLAQNNFSIYPNPAEEMLNINWNQVPNEETQITIFNLVGKKVAEFSQSASDEVTSLPINSLNASVYLLQIQNEDVNVTKKFIKK